MSDNSKIEWTDATWNPVRGCTEISPGCAHCYAKTFSERCRGHDFDVASVMWNLRWENDFHGVFSSDGAQNYGQWSDPLADRLVEEARGILEGYGFAFPRHAFADRDGRADLHQVGLPGDPGETSRDHHPARRLLPRRARAADGQPGAEAAGGRSGLAFGARVGPHRSEHYEVHRKA